MDSKEQQIVNELKEDLKHLSLTSEPNFERMQSLVDEKDNPDSRFFDVECDDCRKYLVSVESKIDNLISSENLEVYELYKHKSFQIDEIEKRIKTLLEKIFDLSITLSEIEEYYKLIKTRYDCYNDPMYNRLQNFVEEKKAILQQLKLGNFNHLPKCFHKKT